MTSPIDEVIEGDGNLPSEDQIYGVREQMRAAGVIRIDDRAIRKTHKELEARGFEVCLSRVQRTLNKIDAQIPQFGPSATDKPAAKPKTERHRALKVTRDDLKIDDISLITTMAVLLQEKNSSAVLAIRENRARMALNIIIAERMAASPNLLLLDMRGTACLVDALTNAANLSGGAAIDVRAADASEMRDGRIELKDITPAAKTALQSDIEQWRKQRNGNAAPAA